jgi:SAM-dependent methyltransferase
MTAESTRWAEARDERGRAFGSVAAAYAAWRPTYPDDAVSFLTGVHPSPLRIVDVGAGTGLLSARLVDAGHDVAAVDTSADMLAELSARLPRVPTSVNGAEALPLPDADVDLVVAGQAAHWFDPVAAGREFLRVLRPGGAVGLIWNTWEDRTPWAHELAALLAPDTRVQQGDTDEGNAAVVRAFAAAMDADVEAFTTRWVHRVPPAAVVGRTASSSRVALLDDEEREEYLGRVRDLLETHPDTRGRDVIDLDYVTSAWRLTPR